MKIVAEIRQALADAADEKTREAGAKFFKEEVKTYGVKTPAVRKIAREAFAELRDLPKAEIFALCEELWRSGMMEEGYVACELAYALRRQFEPIDFATFERWVGEYVTNWAACDTLCNHSVGALVEMFPEKVAELKLWARSENRWMRRAAAVSLIIPARRGLFLPDVLQIAETLLLDGDDLVQKGYGWMLKAASMSESFVKGDPETKREHTDAVFGFVMAHRSAMPRTALRYAIEKMPPELRAEAMKR